MNKHNMLCLLKCIKYHIYTLTIYFRDEVISKLKEFFTIAEKYNIILLHQNEKDI